MASNLQSWERGLSIGVGGVLLWHAIRHERWRGTLASAGVSLVARGLSGYCPVNAAVGRGSSETRDALGEAAAVGAS